MRSRSDFRPAQLAISDEIVEYEGGIIVLGMGGGKTAATLDAIARLLERGDIDQALVLAPARVVSNVWPNEPRKWDHLQNLRVVAVEGPPERRRVLLSRQADVHVVSIENTKWLVDTLVHQRGRMERTLLVIDEISKLKGPTGKRAGQLLSIAARFAGRFGLTGTPRPNGYEDLFNPIRIVSGDPSAWGMGLSSFFKFRAAYFRPLDYHGYNWAPHDFAKLKMDRVIDTWCSYAPVDDLVLPDLLTGDDFVEHVKMTSEQQKHTDDLVKEMVTLVEGTNQPGENVEDRLVQALSQGALSGKLIQVIQGYLYGDTPGDRMRLKENPKLERLGEMDDALAADRAVVVYGLRAEIPDLARLFEGRGRSVGLLGGGVSATKATETIEAWNRGEIDRLLAHPASAGHGIELQFGGHHMIHYHPTWSSEGYDQIIKRLHRPGQAHDVVNYWLMMDGSVDELKYARVESKLKGEEAFRQILRNIVKGARK